MGPGDLVDENKPVKMVYLMLDRASFKGIGFNAHFNTGNGKKSLQR